MIGEINFLDKIYICATHYKKLNIIWNVQNCNFLFSLLGAVIGYTVKSNSYRENLWKCTPVLIGESSQRGTLSKRDIVQAPGNSAKQTKTFWLNI